MYVCICMYACAHGLFTRTKTVSIVRICMYVCMYMYVYACAHGYSHVLRQYQLCAYVCMYVCMYVYACAHRLFTRTKTVSIVHVKRSCRS
jgi:hypothetical protein